MDKQPHGRKSSTEIGRFAALFTEGEQWLMRRTLRYAKERGYTRYTSTLEEAWRVSIAGLTESLIASVEARGWDLELDVDEDLAADPAMAFGILEAQRHRSRGVTLAMYMGLTKYYKQAYLDLVDESEVAVRTADRYRSAVGRFFDRVEIGFCDEWARHSGGELLTELQDENRRMTNEKNKYLTVFESLNSPVLVLDDNGAIDNVNEAAARIFSLGGVSGSAYYSGEAVGEPFAPLQLDIAVFMDGSSTEASLERRLQTVDGYRYFLVHLKRMLDVSGKFTRVTAILTDITERKDAEEAFRSMSLRDDLTGVHNRRGFEAVGAKLISVARRLEQMIALVYVDLDGLKDINDELGHQAGDAALRTVAGILTETFRESDVIGRLGGDEFAVLLAAADAEHVDEAVARVKRRQSRGVGVDSDGAVSYSVGVARCEDPATCELGELIAVADERMYENKQRRRTGRT